MKTIGLMGGMSWESSLEYYRIINEEANKILGQNHSAKCIMYSFDFHEIEVLQRNGDWQKLKEMMVAQAENLKKAGADFIVICTNTMHLLAPDIERETGMKVIHIVEATGEEIKRKGLKRIILLGTKFTMEGTFYKDILKTYYDIDIITPNEEDRQIIHDIIYDELVRGIITNESRDKYVSIINNLADENPEGVILGCTEIPSLIKPADVRIPIFDTTLIHSIAAVEYSLK